MKPEALVFADDRPMSTSDDLYQWAVDAEHLIRAQQARIAELESIFDEQQAGIERLRAEPLRKPISQPAIPAEVPYDNCLNDLGWDLNDFLTKNGATFDGRVFNNMKPFLKACIEKWLVAHPAEGVPAQIETLRSELAEEKEAADNWRRLALQFDNHRLQALWHLKCILHEDSSVDEYKAAEQFLAAPPLDGQAVLAQRIAALAATQPAAQGMDARDAAFEAVRKAFCKLQRYSFALDSRGNLRRCADHCGNWVEFEAVHTLFEPQSVDAALAAQAKQEAAAPGKADG